MDIRTCLSALAIVGSCGLVGCDNTSNPKPAPAPPPSRPAGGAAGPKAPTAAPAATGAPAPTQPKPAAPKTEPPKPATGVTGATGSTGAAPVTAPSVKPAAVPPPAPKPEAPKPEAPKEPEVLNRIETPTRLIIEELAYGTGTEVVPHSAVTIHYRGTLATGEEFDSSFKTGKPATFNLDQLVKGWQEGMPGMKVGGKRRLIVPPALGWGTREVKDGTGKVIIPANSMVIFEIELIGTQK